MKSMDFIRIAAVVMILSGFMVHGHAQEKRTAVGLRLGGESGLNLRLADDDYALEGILGFDEEDFRMTALIEKFKPAFTDRFENVAMYTGMGCHIGIDNYEQTKYRTVDGVTYFSVRKRHDPVAGIDFVVGLEYKFKSLPLLASIDYKPYFDFFGEKDFNLDLWDFGLSVKYILNH
jgi:hypothetical protein